MTYFFSLSEMLMISWYLMGGVQQIVLSSKIQSHPGPAFVLKQEAKNAYKMEFLRIKHSLKEH